MRKTEFSKMSWRTRLRYVMKWRCSPMITWNLISQLLTFYSTSNFVNHSWSGSVYASPESSSGTSLLQSHLRDCSLIAALKVYIPLFMWFVLILVSQVQSVCDCMWFYTQWSTLINSAPCLFNRLGWYWLQSLFWFVMRQIYTKNNLPEIFFFCRFLERSL